MSKAYKLCREQVVKTDIGSAWDFIRSPRNLEVLTPPDLSLKIITDLPDEMYDGLLVELCVDIPIIGKQNWLSEIKYVHKGCSFVDEQRIGPYKFWQHYHGIKEDKDGVRFIDRVHYVLPFGILGTIGNAIFIRKKLKYIFDYRAQRLPQLLAQS